MPIPVRDEVRVSYHDGQPSSVTIANLHGTPGKPVAIDGDDLLVDGGGTRIPLYISQCSHLLISELNLCNSSSCVVYCVDSHHIRFSQVLAWDAADGNFFPWLLYRCNHVAVLDCAGWGRGRKIFQPYKTDDTVVTRFYGRWGGMTTPQPGSCGVFAPSYNCFRTLMLYCLAHIPTDDQHLVNAGWVADSMDSGQWAGQPANAIVAASATISPLERDAFHIGNPPAISYRACVRATPKDVTPISNAGEPANSPTGRQWLQMLRDAWVESPIRSRLRDLAEADPIADIDTLLKRAN